MKQYYDALNYELKIKDSVYSLIYGTVVLGTITGFDENKAIVKNTGLHLDEYIDLSIVIRADLVDIENSIEVDDICIVSYYLLRKITFCKVLKKTNDIFHLKELFIDSVFNLDRKEQHVLKLKDKILTRYLLSPNKETLCM